MASRNYCFTAFDKQEAENLKNLDITKYICWGEEICPSTGNLHYQGYIELNKPQKITYFKNNGAPTTHFEKRMGTADEAIKYCAKDGIFIEFGERSQKGKRSDLLILKENIDKGLTMKEIADLHFSSFIKYNKGIEKYSLLNKSIQRDWIPNVEIHIGGPGSGKSHYCKTKYPNAYWVSRPNNNAVWFDGYDNHETIILDDFYGWLPWDMLLRLCDKYPLILPTKGGSTNCVARNIIITSNKNVTQWYTHIEDITPFIRRITLFKDDYVTCQYVDMNKFNSILSQINKFDEKNNVKINNS